MYTWEFTPEAARDFKKLTPEIQKRIFKKLDYFVSSGIPLKFAERLVDYTEENIGLESEITE